MSEISENAGDRGRNTVKYSSLIIFRFSQIIVAIQQRENLLK